MNAGVRLRREGTLVKTADSEKPASAVHGFRRVGAAVMALTIAIGGVFTISQAAEAADGTAPPTHEYRVLTTEHTDAISTFWDDGTFSLGSKADVDGALKVRFPADGLLIQVDDTARVASWPAGKEFVAEGGVPVWLAPMAQTPGVVWPGFSTESVPAGTLSTPIVFTLDSVIGSGPDAGGTVEVWTSDLASGLDERLWSSDDGISSFSRPINTHLHANWAFTQPGSYQLTATASASTADGTEVSDTKTYLFYAGELPGTAETTTSVRIEGASTISHGAAVELRADVAPSSAEGYIEFRNGDKVLGHEPVSDGVAKFTVRDLSIGAHSLSARFVPAVANYASASTSAAVSINVTDASGSAFELKGLQRSYEPGEEMSVRVTGATLREKEYYGLLARQIGTAFAGHGLATNETGNFSRVMSADDSGFEFAAAVMTCADWDPDCEYRDYGTVIAQSAWVQTEIAMLGSAPVLTQEGGEGPLYPGDERRLTASNLHLAEGETVEFGHLVPGQDRGWDAGLPWVSEAVYPEPHIAEVSRMAGSDVPYLAVIRVIRDGVAVRISQPVEMLNAEYEILVQGVQPLYLEHTALNASATLYPVREEATKLTYRWEFSKSSGFYPDKDTWAESKGIVEELSHPVTMSEHEGYLRLAAYRAGGQLAFYSSGEQFRVTDDPNAQLFLLKNLAEHYHQGDNVDLGVILSPGLQPGDELLWEWKWPGGEWTGFPGASGLSAPVTAEQALHEVQVRAILSYADESKASLITDPVTIRNDDHGAPARQQLSIEGATAVAQNETVQLTAALPAKLGAEERYTSVLSDYKWERKPVGANEFTVVAGQTGSSLSFTAGAEDDGAAYRVSLIKPNGELGYGPSATVVLEVSESTPTPEPEVSPAPGNTETSQVGPDGKPLATTGAEASLSIALGGGGVLLAVGTMLVLAARRRAVGQRM